MGLTSVPDLHKVLEIEPEHQIATSLLSIPQAAVIRKVNFRPFRITVTDGL